MWSHVLGVIAPILLAGLGLLGCAFPRHEVEAPRPTPELNLRATVETKTESLVLITIDGVMWQDVFGGVSPTRAKQAGMSESAVVGPLELMPHLYSLARRGIVSGAPGYGPPMRASGPNYVSL
ncbi:MAG: hypothetical protein EBZ48_18120, partial [Proteobacteria bacterium]|nr:hypothetical protein [Pseudomonadota bacterium]